MADDRPTDPHTTAASGPAAGSADAPAPRPGASRRGLTIALVGLVAVIGVALAVILGRVGESNPVDDVSSALAANATLLAGPLNPTGLQHARCVKDSETAFTCTPVVGNATEKPIKVVWQNDVVTKRLAGTNLTQPLRSGSEVAAALSADEQATVGRTLKYGCAFTMGLTPAGERNDGSPGGFRCAAPAPGGAKDEFIQRYVEFAADGSVSRDFMLTTTS